MVTQEKCLYQTYQLASQEIFYPIVHVMEDQNITFSGMRRSYPSENLQWH